MRQNEKETFSDKIHLNKPFVYISSPKKVIYKLKKLSELLQDHMG